MHSAISVVALCSLLATAAARPAAVDSSACSISCSGRNFWQGYVQGSSYNYNFEQDIEVSSGLNQQRLTMLKVKGTARVEAHSACEMQLIVTASSSEVSKSPNEPDSLVAKAMPDDVKAALQLPLRFSFEDGRIRTVCFGSDDTRASINFKRGLLSHLNFYLAGSQQGQIMETDILGDCWANYKIDSQGMIQKTKDLATCQSSFDVFPRAGVKSEASDSGSQQPTVLKGSVSCSVGLDGADERVKTSECTEKRILSNNINDEQKGENVQVVSKISLASVETTVSTPAEIFDRSDLRYEQKSSLECQQTASSGAGSSFEFGSECLERQLPAEGQTSADFKKAAKAIIVELCSETKGAEMSATSAKKFAQLVRSLRGVTERSDLQEIIDYVDIDDYCSDNPRLLQIVMSAIPNIGTATSVRLMLESIKSGDGETPSAWYKTGIAMMPNPTAEIIGEVLNAVKPLSSEDTIYPDSKNLLALASMTARYCVQSGECDSSEVVAKVEEFLFEKIGDSCSKIGEEDAYSFAGLLAIGNLGRVKGGSATLLKCAKSSSAKLFVKVAALRSLKSFASIEEESLEALVEIVGDQSLDSELRIVAFQAAVKFADQNDRINQNILSDLSSLMADESDDRQVQMYIYNHLKNWLRMTKSRAQSGSVRRIVREFKNFIDKEGINQMGFSSHIRKQFKIPNMKSRLDMQSSLIYSSKAALPRYMDLNLTVESPLYGEAVSIFGAEIRTEGLESTIKSLFMKSERLRRRRRQVSFDLTERQKEHQNDEIKRFELNIRQSGQIIQNYAVESNILDIALAVGPVGSPKELLEALPALGINLGPSVQAGNLMESTIVIPTITGFPILMKKEINYVIDTGITPSFTAGAKMEVNLKVQPAASVYMSRAVSIDAPFERAGISTSTSILTSSGVNFKTIISKASSNPEFSFKIEPLQKRQKLVDLKTEAVFFSHQGRETVKTSDINDAETPTEVCSSEYGLENFGAKLCEASTYGDAKKSIFFFRQTPGEYRMYVDVNEDVKVFEATASMTKTDSKKEILLVFGDQSNPKRHVKFSAGYEKTADGRKINLELANPIFPIKWTSTSSLAGNDQAVNADLVVGPASYKFSGSRKASDDGTVLNGNFFEVKNPAGKVGVICRYLISQTGYNVGLDLQLNAKNKLSFVSVLSTLSDSAKLEFLATHEQDGSPITSYDFKVGAVVKIPQQMSVDYSLQIVNPNGNNVAQLLYVSSNVDADTGNFLVKAGHSFVYGAELNKKILDFKSSLMMNVEVQERGFAFTGDGSAKVGGQESKLSDISLTVGLTADEMDGRSQNSFARFKCKAEYSGSTSNIDFSVQYMANRWTLSQQYISTKMEVTTTSAAGAEAVDSLELKHSVFLVGRPSISQVFALTLSSKPIVDLRQSLNPAEGEDQKYVAQLLASYLGKQQLAIDGGFSSAGGKYEITNSVSLRSQKVWELTQSFLLKYYKELVFSELELVHEHVLMGERRFLKHSEKFTDAFTQKVYDASQYAKNYGTGKFTVSGFAMLVWRCFSEYQSTSSSEVEVGEMTRKISTTFDFMQADGVCWRTETTNFIDGVETKTSAQLTCKSFGNSLKDIRRNYRLDVEMGSKWSVETGFEVRATAGGISVKQILRRTSIRGVFDLSASGFYDKVEAGLNFGSSFNLSNAGSDIVRIGLNGNANLPKTSIILTVAVAEEKQIKFDYNLDVQSGQSGLESMENTLVISNSIDAIKVKEINVNFNQGFVNGASVSLNGMADGKEIIGISFDVNSAEMKASFNSALRAPINFDSTVTFGTAGQVGYSAELSYSESSVVAAGNILYSMPEGTAFEGRMNGSLVTKKVSGVPDLNLISNSQIFLSMTPKFNLDMNVTHKNDDSLTEVLTLKSKMMLSPLQISGQINTPIAGIGRLGLNAIAGPFLVENSEINLWLATSKQEHALKYAHIMSVSDSGNYSLQGHIKAESPYFKLGQKKIEAFLNVNGKDILNYNLAANATLPQRYSNSFALDLSSSETAQRIAFSEGTPSSMKKVLQYRNEMKRNGASTQGNFTLLLGGLRNLRGVYITGDDYYFYSQLENVGSYEFTARAIYMIKGNTYPLISGLPVADANLGLQLKAGDLDMYSMRAGSAASYKWETVIKIAEAETVRSTVNVENGRVTSGSGKVYDKEISYTSSEAGTVSISEGSGDTANSIKYEASPGGLSLTFTMGPQKSCASYSMAASSVTINYGSCTAPTQLSLSHNMTGFSSFAEFNGGFSLELKKPEGYAQQFHFLPGFSFNIDLMPPFSVVMQASDAFKKQYFEVNGRLPQQSDTFKYVSNYDFTQASENGNFVYELFMGNKLTYQAKVNYNVPAVTFSAVLLKGEDYKLDLNEKQLTVFAQGKFNAEAKYLTSQTIGDSNTVTMLDCSVTVLDQTTPNKLKLWYDMPANGYKAAFDFIGSDGKTASLVIGASDINTENGLKAKTEAVIRSNQIPGASVIVSKSDIDFEFVEDSAYIFKLDKTLDLDQAPFLVMNSEFKGRSRQFPWFGSINMPSGYAQASMSYSVGAAGASAVTFNVGFPKVGSFVMSLEELAYKLDSYYNPLMDFSLAVTASSRQFYLARRKTDVSNLVAQQELQVFLDKNTKQGVTVTVLSDYSIEGSLRNAVEIELPTRTVGYDRTLRMVDGEVNYDLMAFGQKPITAENSLIANFSSESGADLDSWFYKQSLKLSAPFLKNPMTKSMELRVDGSNFRFFGSSSHLPVDAANITVTYKKYWDAEKEAYQSEVNATLSQKKDDVKASLRIIGSSRKLRDSKIFSTDKFMTEYNIRAMVPSLQVNTRFLIRSVPFEELTIANDIGASFSFRNYNAYQGSRLTIFASSGARRASQLTITSNSQRFDWRLSLDYGKGSMSPDSESSIPFYEPDQLIFRANAGVSKCGTKLRFGAMAGQTSISDVPSWWSPERIPSSFSFFFAGAKLLQNNSVNYMSHWRLGSLQNDAVTAGLGEFANADNFPLGFSTMQQLLGGLSDSQMANIDVQKVMSILNEISSNDIDKLSKWAADARRDNLLFMGSVASTASRIYQMASVFTGRALQSLVSWSPADVLPTDEAIWGSVRSLISKININIDWNFFAGIWTKIVNSLRAGSMYISSAVNMYMPDIGIGSVAGASADTARSVSSYIRDAVSKSVSALGLDYLVQSGQSVIEKMFSSESDAFENIAQQIYNSLLNLGSPLIVSLADFVEYTANLNADVSRIFQITGIQMEDTEPKSIDSYIAQTVYPDGQAYAENLLKSVRLLLEGNVAGSARQFVNVDAFYITSWNIRPVSELSTISGSAYIPFYLKSFRSSRQQLLAATGFSGRSLKMVMRPYYEMKYLMRMKAQVAQVSDDQIMTFDEDVFTPMKPCKYVLAHDFSKGIFTVVQAFTSVDGGLKRGDMFVKFLGQKLRISPNFDLQVNGQAKSYPTEVVIQQFRGQFIRATRTTAPDEEAEIIFSDGDAATYSITCSPSSCSIKAHGIQRGKLNGAMGSNDGNQMNDVADDHDDLWKMADCAA